EMLRLDLQAAGIPYRDEAGRVADFHSLRHSYITLLDRSGVSPKVAKELARHSDIRLTMNVYTHAGLHDLAGAVNGLPSILPSGGPTNQNVEVLRATGTDGDQQDVLPLRSNERQNTLGPNLGLCSAISGDCERQAETETRVAKSTKNPLRTSVFCNSSGDFSELRDRGSPRK